MIISGHNSQYVQGRPESLVIGGDHPRGPALWLDRDMDRGSSGPSNTFDSPTLVTAGQFRLRDCELWALSDAVASELGLFPSQDFSTEPNFTPSTRGMRNSRIYQIYRLGSHEGLHSRVLSLHLITA